MVVGDVRSPGRYPAPPGLTLTRAVREAGGMTTLEGGDEATVTRLTCDGRRVAVRIRVSDILAGLVADLAVAPRDIVHVKPCGACIY